MTTYLALLRGINVGGNNKIAMPALKKAFEQHGFTGVTTYINSGNLMFDSALDAQAVQAASEVLIASEFGFSVAVGVYSAAELRDALAHAPAWWNSDPASKHNAIFVIPPATAEAVCALVGETKPAYEQVHAYGNVIFWSAPIETFSRTRWSKIVQNKAAYNAITIRNANTFRKLVTLTASR
ncbi:MAG: DUF1697 domain-containing protein [Oscillospiraceae bacterium]